MVGSGGSGVDAQARQIRASVVHPFRIISIDCIVTCCGDLYWPIATNVLISSDRFFPLDLPDVAVFWPLKQAITSLFN